MGEFRFLDTAGLADEVMALRLRALLPEGPRKGWTPAYDFDMVLQGPGTVVGDISLRVGQAPIIHLGGHIGYTVYRAHRGHRYARRACGLLLPLARAHGMAAVRITCNPDNLPSRRTIEGLGATLLGIEPVPPGSELWLRGDREKCIFELTL